MIEYEIEMEDTNKEVPPPNAPPPVLPPDC